METIIIELHEFQSDTLRKVSKVNEGGNDNFNLNDNLNLNLNGLTRAIRNMEPAWVKACGRNFALTSRTIAAQRLCVEINAFAQACLLGFFIFQRRGAEAQRLWRY